MAKSINVLIHPTKKNSPNIFIPQFSLVLPGASSLPAASPAAQRSTSAHKRRASFHRKLLCLVIGLFTFPLSAGAGSSTALFQERTLWIDGRHEKFFLYV